MFSLTGRLFYLAKNCCTISFVHNNNARKTKLDRGDKTQIKNYTFSRAVPSRWTNLISREIWQFVVEISFGASVISLTLCYAYWFQSRNFLYCGYQQRCRGPSRWVRLRLPLDLDQLLTRRSRWQILWQFLRVLWVL